MLYKDKEALKSILQSELENFQKIKNSNYSIDIARGKPCKEQLDSVMSFFDDVKNIASQIPSEYRNYGLLDGIVEMKKIFADILGLDVSNIIAAGNSSLNLMYDTVQRAMQFGVMSSEPWNKQGKIKFITPVPGYDRHFGVCAHFGIEMINVPLNDDGPDMDIVEELVKSDKSIKGMWCVPKYSNPTGITYSDETVTRLAKMQVAAEDFRIFWDNAYVVHDLYDNGGDSLLEIISEAKKYNNEDRIYEFTSTSKITFPGSGVACIAASKANIADILSHIKWQTICYDKINQALHAKYIKNLDNLKEIMKSHANIIRPKFDTVINSFEKEFGSDCNIAKWTKPNGGYFISLDVLEGCAKDVVALCKEAGLTVTPAGATFPHAKDPLDSNIRIAPTFTSNEELLTATKILNCCIKIVCIKKLLK